MYLEEVLFQQFHRRRRSVQWDSALIPPVSTWALGTTTTPIFPAKIITSLEDRILRDIRALQTLFRNDDKYTHFMRILDAITHEMESRCAAEDKYQARISDFSVNSDLTGSSGAVRRVFTGPRVNSIDPTLFGEYSMLDYAPPSYSSEIDRVIPYFWTLSTKEAMACDACLLSGIEYDGLPILFYRDMAQQAADEARHSVMFLNLAIELMPKLREDTKINRKLFDYVTKFLDGRGKLPVPVEGGLFDTMWNATLMERLILMQIDTEGLAVAGARRAAKSKFAQLYPSIQRAFEIDANDEIGHARIGHRWLKFLIPSAQARAETIDEARKLRGLLLLTCFANSNTTLEELIVRYSGAYALPTQEFFD